MGFGILAFLYVLLTLEVMHRTSAALLTLAVVMVLNVFLRFADFRDLLEGIDIDTILLLMCMMIIVGVLSKTGFFSYVASKILSHFYRNSIMLILILSGFTAAVSAFIDNVTTVLLVTPMVLAIFNELRLDPRPALLAIVFASNIGGTATLIGDPPNIIIGSVAKLGFMSFIRNLTPIVAVCFFVFILVFKVMNKKWLVTYNEFASRVELGLKHYQQVDKPFLMKMSVILLLVITLFFLEDILEYPPAIPAIIGAGLAVTLARKYIKIEDLLHFVDWTTLVFFISMFMIVRGVQRLGTIDFIAHAISGMAGTSVATLMLILWISAVMSAFIDNIPFVMAMVPTIPVIASSIGISSTPLYWALSLGACLGGNGTLVGASANVVVAGIAEKYGYHISFGYFLKYGMSTMLITVGVSAIYLILRYAL
ncbi:MAG: ArsB/NhaD family transporter [Desulfurococcales archaeon]|nr:ArsB/NhaD family transporter [Desulfurococcales archaeon]